MSTELKDALLQALKPAPLEHPGSILEWKPFPAAPIVYLVTTFDDRVAVVNQNATSDRAAAIRFLRETSAAHLDRVTKEQPWSAAPFETDGLAPFDLRVVEHPSIGPKGLNKATHFLAGRLYQTYPLYDCEFMRSDSTEDFRLRMDKYVNWTDWARRPQPAIGIRVNFLKSKVKTTGGKSFMVASLDEAQQQVAKLDKEPGFVELMNHRGSVLRVERGEQTLVSIDGAPVASADRRATVDGFARGAAQPGASTV